MRTGKLESRVQWVDTLKGICMIFVVISHACPPISWTRIYTPFFLTGFFFASGYTFDMKKTWKEFVTKKVRTLLIPMIFLSIINGIVGMLFKNVPFYNRLLGIILQQAGGYESLWFFPCLFVCEVMLYWIVYFSPNELIVTIIAHIISSIGFSYIAGGGYPLLWQFEIACVSLQFLSWGLLYSKYEKFISQFFQSNIKMITICVIYILLCLKVINDVNIHEERFGNEWLFVLEAFLSILLIITMAKKLQKNQILNYIGTHSIIFFAFQGFLLQTIRKVLVFIGFHGTSILCILSAAIALVILSIVAYWIYQYMPFLIGKAKK